MEASIFPRRGISEEFEDESVFTFYGEEDLQLMEDATPTSSSSSTSLRPAPPPSSSGDPVEEGPLFDMSSLVSLLPMKRGLSKHFDGKSQSFTSLANARSLEDLAKPERRHKKKLKHCDNYEGESWVCRKVQCPKARSVFNRASSSSLVNGRRHRFLSHKPPTVCPQVSGGTSCSPKIPLNRL